MKSAIKGIIIGVLLGITLSLWYSGIVKEWEKRQGEVASTTWKQNHFLLNKENLYNELVAQGVDFPKIVEAQALLETEYFRAYSCFKNNNLFGLKDKEGKYIKYSHWTLSVEAYKQYVQTYDQPPEDYYKYLQEKGFADSLYIKKLKVLTDNL